jgi:hypothetical protein
MAMPSTIDGSVDTTAIQALNKTTSAGSYIA